MRIPPPTLTPAPTPRPTRLLGVGEAGSELLQVYIKSGGKEMSVYSQEGLLGGGGKKGYICSEIGQPYSIHIMTKPMPLDIQQHFCQSCASAPHLGMLYPTWRYDISVDGISVKRVVMNSSPIEGYHRSDFETLPIDAYMSGRPIFSPPQLSESANSLTPLAASSLGTIKITFKRCRVNGERVKVIADTAEKAGVGIINEREKKSMIGSVTKFANIAPANDIKTTPGGLKTRTYIDCAFHPDDTDARPAYTFEFVYRPRDLLRAQGLLNDGQYDDVKALVETAIRPQPNIIDLTSPKPIRSSWIDPFSIASSFASGLKPNSQVKSKVNLDEEGEEEDIKPDIPLIPKEPNELIDLTLSDVEDKGNKVGTVRDGDKEHGGSGDGKYEHESPAVTEKIIEFGHAASNKTTTVTSRARSYLAGFVESLRQAPVPTPFSSTSEEDPRVENVSVNEFAIANVDEEDAGWVGDEMDEMEEEEVDSMMF